MPQRVHPARQTARVADAIRMKSHITDCEIALIYADSTDYLTVANSKQVMAAWIALGVVKLYAKVENSAPVFIWVAKALFKNDRRASRSSGNPRLISKLAVTAQHLQSKIKSVGYRNNAVCFYELFPHGRL